MKPRILALDIETCPGLAYVWNLKDQYTPIDRLVRAGHTISVGWQWVGDRTVHYADSWKFDDRKSRKRMLEQIHAALERADAVLTFNGLHFDMKRLNGEFVLFGLRPLPRIPHIDLYQTVRQFGFMSGKMGYVCELLGGRGKVSTGGFPLWEQYMAGNPKARDKMRRYNKRDVRCLTWLYNRLFPYIVNHPALHDRPDCPACGSKRVQRRGSRRTTAYSIERLHCQSCGRYSDGKRKRLT